MSANSQEIAADLQQSLRSIASLEKSAIFSVVLLVLAIVAALGAAYYSVTTIAPLQGQVSQLKQETVQLQVSIESKKVELAELTEQASQLAERKAELFLDNRQLRSDQAEARSALETIDSTLSRIQTQGLSAKLKVDLAAARSEAAMVTEALGANEPLGIALANPVGIAVPAAASLQDAIAGLFAPNAAARIRSYDTLIENHSGDPQIVPALLEYAKRNRSNGNGVYNTMVVLSHLPKSTLRPHVAEIESYAASVNESTPKIKERAAILLRRLPRG